MCGQITSDMSIIYEPPSYVNTIAILILHTVALASKIFEDMV